MDFLIIWAENYLQGDYLQLFTLVVLTSVLAVITYVIGWAFGYHR